MIIFKQLSEWPSNNLVVAMIAVMNAAFLTSFHKMIDDTDFLLYNKERCTLTTNQCFQT